MSTREFKKRKETRVPKKEEDKRIDLRSDVAWSLYIDSRSDTFNNAYASAVKAGYTPATAKRITAETWWQRNVEMLKEMLPKAEDVLLEDLDLDTEEPMLINQEIQYKVNPNLRRIRSETAKFIASTVGRAKYHTKVEVEANGIISLVQGNPLIDNLFGNKE